MMELAMNNCEEEELVVKLIEEHRDANALFYSYGVPEVPFSIGVAANLGDGRFLVSSYYLIYSFEFDTKLIPIVASYKNGDLTWIQLRPEGLKFWTPPMDARGGWLKGFSHHCCYAVVEKDGRLIYPRYVLRFPVTLPCGKVLVLHEKLPIQNSDQSKAKNGEADITVDGRELHRELDRMTRWSLLVVTSSGTESLVEVGDEAL